MSTKFILSFVCFCCFTRINSGAPKIQEIKFLVDFIKHHRISGLTLLVDKSKTIIDVPSAIKTLSKHDIASKAVWNSTRHQSPPDNQKKTALLFLYCSDTLSNTQMKENNHEILVVFNVNTSNYIKIIRALRPQIDHELVLLVKMKVN